MKLVKLDDIIHLLYESGELVNKELKIIPPIKMQHGSCCCCTDCGYYHDDCVCIHNEWVKDLLNLKIEKVGE